MWANKESWILRIIIRGEQLFDTEVVIIILYGQACHKMMPTIQTGELNESLPDHQVSFDSIVTGRGREVVNL